MESVTGSERDAAGLSASRQGLGRLYHVMAAASLLTALVAVMMGGVVRVTGSGLGCPDWPLCHGRVIPPWELAPWLEYLHRLSAAVSGVFILLLAATAFMRYGLRSRMFFMASVAGALMVTQAALGAFTVLSELSPGIALVHTGVATGLVGALAFITAGAIRPRWLHEGVTPSRELDGLRRLTAALGVATFILVLSGAYVTRSYGAPLACTQIPLCGTALWDMTEAQWIHMTHRAIGLPVGILMLATLLQAIAARHRGTLAMVGLMALLLAFQMGLGIGNVALRLPPDVRATHLAMAVLFFAVVMLLVGAHWRGAPTDEDGATLPGMGRRPSSGGLQ